jgi:hypothetical protein
MLLISTTTYAKDNKNNDNCVCEGGVTELTLKYTGSLAEANVVVQDKDENILFKGQVKKDGDFIVQGKGNGDKLGTNIYVFVDDIEQTSIHTSCSQPIYPGLVKGDFTVVAGKSLEGGPLSAECVVIPDCGECKGGVTELTLQYTGGLPEVHVVVQDKKGNKLYDNNVTKDGNFTFEGIDKDKKMGTNIYIFVNGVEQSSIHTSCSQPIYPGLVKDAFTVVAGKSLKGGDFVEQCDEIPECGECKGGVTQLKLQYIGKDPVHVVIQDKEKKGNTLYENDLKQYDIFTFEGKDKDKKMGTNIYISLNNSKESIHTSCSQDIWPGMTFGSFLVLEGMSKDGGPLLDPDANSCSVPPVPELATIALVISGLSLILFISRRK